MGKGDKLLRLMLMGKGKTVRLSLTQAQELAELEPWECNCVLPDQSCPASRAAAREVYDEPHL